MILGQLRQNRRRIWPALIVLMGAFLRFYAIGSKTLWLDEAFSIWMAHQPLVESWAWLIRIDQHPPLYYTLLHFWQMIFGDSQGAVRALSALCSSLTIAFFYGNCRRWFDEQTAFMASFVLAVSPFHIHYAQETRMYALVTLGVAATLYFLARILFDGARSNTRLNWMGLAIAQAAVMLTHNTATIFLPLALNLGIGGALLWKYTQGGVSSLPALNDPSFERHWVRGQVLALILWLPWSIPFVIQASGVDRQFWLQPPTFGTVVEVLHRFNFSFLPDWFSLFHLWDAFYWGLAAFGVYQLRRTPARALLLLSLCLTPVLGELLVSLRRPIFSEHTLIWATLSYYMLLAVGIRGVSHKLNQPITLGPKPAASLNRAPNGDQIEIQRQPRRVGNAFQSIALLLIVGLSLLSLSNYYLYFQKEEWDKAADYVAQNSRPGDLILFNATWTQLPFEYYFRRYQTDMEMHGLPVDLFDRGVIEPKMTAADLPAMRNLLQNHRRVWLIYSHDWYSDPNKIIPSELNRSMQQTDQRSFIGLQVFRYAAR
ncbi:MAG: glycosyltransferase family 39 protein [Chloroflexi bacterium]|nr:glycosyltransferase family 39 protein [Chloroflexota bacterium]